MESQFTIIQTKVLFDKRLKGRDRDILALLQTMSGINGYCWPSYNHIADKLGISRMTAIRAIKKLVFLNYVVKVAGTVGDTNEQSSNRYYVNNNPDAGIVSEESKKNSEVVSAEILPNDKSGVTNCDSDVVTNCDSEIDKFFEKNAHAHARTHEDTQDTPKGETESGLLPEAKPDDFKLSIPHIKSSDEDIRLCKQVSAEWKKAFNKSLWIFGEIVKRKQHNNFYFRVIPHHKSDFDFDYLKCLFANVGENVALIEQDTHFADEERVDYYDA